MSKIHRYRKHPEFTNLEKFVWEGLNRIGRPISEINAERQKPIKDNPAHKKSKDKPIWHDKKELGKFVSKELGLRLEDYGMDMSINPLYKAIANEVGNLRRAGVLIDWRHVKRSKTGMGVWRLDKTKIGPYVYESAEQEIKKKNFHSQGSTCMVFVREKQNAFRNELFLEYGKCALCGFKIPEYMIGAHIVPYHIMRIEDAQNSMNPSNGLLLCRFCDVAFERGSITVGEDLGITISEYLRDQRSSVVQSWLEPIPGELRVRDEARYPPDPRYLRWKMELLQK